MDCKRVGRGYCYLVHFKGYGKEAERWITGSQLDNVDVVDRWWKEYLPMTATGTSTRKMSEISRMPCNAEKAENAVP